jgi:hypothetical protein
MDAELKTYLETMEVRFRAHTEEMEERLKAHTSLECEKIETKLLREFWKWGSTSDIRTRQSMENANALNERMLNAEDRISALERSKLPPRADAA